MDPIRITRLDCWHANQLIYQADGETDDGRSVYVRYRHPWLTCGVGPTPDEAAGADTAAVRIKLDPARITLATLRKHLGRSTPIDGSAAVIEWPDRIDGFHNEPPPPPTG